MKITIGPAGHAVHALLVKTLPLLTGSIVKLQFLCLFVCASVYGLGKPGNVLMVR